MRSFSRGDKGAGLGVPNSDFGVFGTSCNAVALGAPCNGSTRKRVACEREFYDASFCVDDFDSLVREGRGEKRASSRGRSERKSFLAEHSAGGCKSVISLAN